MANASVLIVDDDRSIVRLCQRLLERAGYEVMATTDPLEAARLLEQHKLDLLLSDIRMPVMDGFELTGRARDLQPEIAILFMTGFGTVDTAIQALHRGVDGLILKPFENTSDLVQAVQRALLENRQKKEAARAQALRPLFDVSESLFSKNSLPALQSQITQVVQGMFQVDGFGVYQKSEQDTFQAVIEEQMPDLGDPPVWKALLTRLADQDQAVSFSRTHPLAYLRELVALEWSSVIFTVVRREEGPYWLVGVRNEPAGPFTEAEFELFTILARQAVIAMENARLYGELREYLARVEESQRALVQAEKMAAVGRIMASMAHEINNPLQSVRNCVHLAARTDIDATQRAHYLSMTNDELDRLSATIRQMLDFYRPNQVDRRTNLIVPIVDKVINLLQTQLSERSIRVKKGFGGEELQFYGAADQIQQVVFNLLINAMDVLEEVETDRVIWIDGYFHENELVLCIEDSGPGVQADIRDHLFEPFVSSKSHGTGLGLAVSFGIVQSHKGRLVLEKPVYAQGARFEVHLPSEKSMGI